MGDRRQKGDEETLGVLAHYRIERNHHFLFTPAHEPVEGQMNEENHGSIPHSIGICACPRDPRYVGKSAP